MTVLHHPNATFFQLRGIWTVMAANVILSRNMIRGPFMYSIDLDSSSSGNVVTNNHCGLDGSGEGPVWEGIFTEYNAQNNVITGNTIVGDVANDQHIHINGALNMVVDNTVLRADRVTPGGIAVTSQMKMYNSYALSNRIVGNSVGVVMTHGDGGCDNYGVGNKLDVGAVGSQNAVYQISNLPSRGCIQGTTTTKGFVVSNIERG